MSISTWPGPDDAVEDFYSSYLKLPLEMFRFIQPTASGSGRPPGPRPLLWSANFVLAVAALEAGLEELVFAAHGVRTPTADPNRDNRKSLVESPLTTPGNNKINRLLLSQFGILLGHLPPSACFDIRRKKWARGGAAKGDHPIPGPANWSELSEMLNAVMHIRNGTAHGDVVKLRNPPSTGEGILWVPLQNEGGWSIQQPHALNALRVVVSVFNTVAHELDQELALFSANSPLRSPNDIVQYVR